MDWIHDRKAGHSDGASCRDQHHNYKGFAPGFMEARAFLSGNGNPETDQSRRAEDDMKNNKRFKEMQG